MLAIVLILKARDSPEAAAAAYQAPGGATTWSSVIAQSIEHPRNSRKKMRGELDKLCICGEEAYRYRLRIPADG
jgi:hypothetical protein